MTNSIEKKVENTVMQKKKIPVIDCDLHANPRTMNDLLPYLSDYWADFLVDSQWIGVFAGAPAMVTPTRYRKDSISTEGERACSSLSFFKEQVADRYNYAYAIIYPDAVWNLSASSQHGMATAVASAYNDWQIEHWLSKDSTMLGSVVVAAQDPEAAAREIDRVGGHPQIVQVALPSYCPYGGWGNKRYFPIWEAAVRNGLVVTYHVAIKGGLYTDGFETSCFAENQTNNGLAFQAAMSSLVFGGVFETFKELRILFNEGGFGWVPNAMYTMDTHWPMSRREIPWMKRSPSQQIREQMWFGTQPMIEPHNSENAKHVIELADMIGQDKIVFTSDYPHFSFNPPEITFKHFPKEFREKILYKNAVKLFGLPDPMKDNS
ncbi:amidohydrolase family protein [Neobacillus vireti]|uniref:amidohydrolase family protein n=1 Tax=Neobacillus vireti TaxID=220686 RepID=UPI002FFE036D